MKYHLLEAPAWSWRLFDYFQSCLSSRQPVYRPTNQQVETTSGCDTKQTRWESVSLGFPSSIHLSIKLSIHRSRCWPPQQLAALVALPVADDCVVVLEKTFVSYTQSNNHNSVSKASTITVNDFVRQSSFCQIGIATVVVSGGLMRSVYINRYQSTVVRCARSGITSRGLPYENKLFKSINSFNV